jgi:hypothetical protein
LARVLCALGRLMRHRELSTSFLSHTYGRLAFTGLGWSDLVIGVWAVHTRFTGLGWADFVCGGVRAARAGWEARLGGGTKGSGRTDGRMDGRHRALHLHRQASRGASSSSSSSGIPHFLWVSVSLFLSFVSVFSVISFIVSGFLGSSFLRAGQVGLNQAGRVCPSTIVGWARWCVCSLTHRLAPACLAAPPPRRLPPIDRHTIPHHADTDTETTPTVFPPTTPPSPDSPEA